MYTDVLDIGERHIVLSLSWLQENGFVVDPVGRYLRNMKKSLILSCSAQWITSVSLLNLDTEPLEDVKIVLIIEAREWYSRYG